MNSILAVSRMILVVTLIFLLMPFQALVLLLSPRHYTWIPIHFHRLVCRINGMQIVVRGIPTEQPTLFVCNHSSYMDIVILSSVAPVSFVSKAEVAKWPVFGWLAKLQRTVFINRRRRDAREHLDATTKSLQENCNLVLFPEGTSGDHNRVMPFKPTLFRAADTMVGGKYVRVQPVCLSFVEINNLPVGRFERPYFAWYGDTLLLPHIWKLLSLGQTRFVVEFFPAISRADFASHKEMAQYCHRVISQAHSNARIGRTEPCPAISAAQSPILTA